MSRYIDADTLKIPSEEMVAKMIINSAPHIDIVRCKECIWRDRDNQGEDYCTYAKGLADINESSFCSWGERSRR